MFRAGLLIMKCLKPGSSRESRQRSFPPAALSDRSDSLLALNLQQLLLGLAQHLLPAGITPAHFGDLATQAFVKAAAGISKFRNGRVNSSRVAVLTSLRRAEV